MWGNRMPGISPLTDSDRAIAQDPLDVLIERATVVELLNIQQTLENMEICLN